jgi:hypothetical protein
MHCSLMPPCLLLYSLPSLPPSTRSFLAFPIRPKLTCCCIRGRRSCRDSCSCCSRIVSSRRTGAPPSPSQFLRQEFFSPLPCCRTARPLHFLSAIVGFFCTLQWPVSHMFHALLDLRMSLILDFLCVDLICEFP